MYAASSIRLSVGRLMVIRAGHLVLRSLFCPCKVDSWSVGLPPTFATNYFPRIFLRFVSWIFIAFLSMFIIKIISPWIFSILGGVHSQISSFFFIRRFLVACYAILQATFGQSARRSVHWSVCYQFVTMPLNTFLSYLKGCLSNSLSTFLVAFFWSVCWLVHRSTHPSQSVLKAFYRIFYVSEW